MPFERILLAIDGAEPSDHAFAKAVELASLTGSRLIGLAVEGPLPAYAATIGEVDEVKREKDLFFRRLADRARENAADAGVDLEIELRAGHAAELIVHFAREVQADLIVLGHRGHFLRNHLLGSTADRVSEHANCPVMIVRQLVASRPIEIPGRPPLELAFLVLDVNGTLTDRGELIEGVEARLQRLRETLDVQLLSADTFGTLQHVANTLGVGSRIIGEGAEKAALVRELGARRCAAIGNGTNDAAMLREAALGIAIIGPEGAAAATITAADIVCRSVVDALALLLDDNALAATLRPQQPAGLETSFRS